MDPINQAPQPPQQNQLPQTNLPKSKTKFPFILGGVLLLLLVGGGAYYLGTQLNKEDLASSNQNKIDILPTSTVQSIPTETATSSPAQSTNYIPSDWTFKTSSTCNVSFPIPPKKSPYYTPKTPSSPGVGDDGRYWIFEESNNTEDKLFKNIAYTIMRGDGELGSGYVSGMVTVNCGQNTNNYTTQTLLDSYTKNFTDGTYAGLTVSKKEFTTLWGRQVAAIYVEGGMAVSTKPEYLFATKNHVYKIDKVSMSQNTIIQQTTDTVLKNLQFKD